MSTSEPLPESSGRQLLARLLEAKGIEHFSCPVCSEEAWDAFSDVAMIAVLPEEHPAAGSTVHYMTTTCVSCGYTMMFDLEVLEMRGKPREH